MNKKMIGLMVVVALVPLAVYAFYYPQLPDQVATHFDFQGNANGYTSRNGLWLPLATPLWVLPLLVVAPRLEARRERYRRAEKFYPAFVVAMTVALSALMTAIVVNTLPGVAVNMSAMAVAVVIVAAVFAVLFYRCDKKQS